MESSPSLYPTQSSTAEEAHKREPFLPRLQFDVARHTVAAEQEVEGDSEVVIVDLTIRLPKREDSQEEGCF